MLNGKVPRDEVVVYDAVTKHEVSGDGAAGMHNYRSAIRHAIDIQGALRN